MEDFVDTEDAREEDVISEKTEEDGEDGEESEDGGASEGELEEAAARTGRRELLRRSFFLQGTLGASLELKLLFLLMGAVPGTSFTAFYGSMGFLLGEEGQDRSLFAQERNQREN